MLDWPTACALPPVIDKAGVSTGVDQVYVVPVGTIPFVTLVGVAVKAVPPQIVLDIAFMYGFGLTVTVTVKVLPVLLPDNGVNV